MTQSLFIVLFGLMVTIYAAAPKCRPNEVVANCSATCDVDNCPTKANYDRSCPTPSPCPPPTCKCGFNYSKAKNGTCIPTRDCPAFPCPCNEEYVACPPYCPTDDCSQATPDGRCPLLGNILIVVRCQPACRCIKGYWRKNGVCVPYNQCPGKSCS